MKPARPSHRRSPARSFLVDITLSIEQIQTFYAGQVSAVWARDVHGVRLQFPLTALRPFVGHHGVRGRFRVQIDADNRLLNIDKVT